MSEMNIPQITISYKGGKTESHKISCSKDAFEVGKHLFNQDTIEYSGEFLVIYLDAKHHTVGWFKSAIGGISSCVVDPRTILGIALQAPVTSILLLHNHPSGNMTPSRADKEITRKISQAGSLLDIDVLDHIIVGPGDEYYSFADCGEMEF